MSRTLEHFETITQIPHCSHEAQSLRDYIEEFALSCGYSVDIDSAGNILIYRGSPHLCLQAHYDMVCMGRAPKIETYIEDGWMMARDSSLGADNGIAIAMMMSLMESGYELEFLLTADEEVGLVGAMALEFDLQSRYMLNLDSEDETEVYIGCAGGADIVGRYDGELVDGSGECYEISVRGLSGGHSGVDIDKDIPSATKLLAEYLHNHDITELATIYAGERSNSIPANAVAIIRSSKALEPTELVECRRLDETPQILSHGADIIELLHRFRHGVHSFNEELNTPQSSINLAIVTSDERGGVTIESSARGMSIDSLESVTSYAVKLLEQYGFTTDIRDRYPAWRPDINPLTDITMEEMQKVFGTSRTTAIHAGLECGVISKIYPHISIASIGPTIQYPHSTRERVDIHSVERTEQVLRAIIDRIESVR